MNFCSLNEIFLEKMNELYISEYRSDELYKKISETVTNHDLQEEISRIKNQSLDNVASLDEMFKNMHIRPIHKKNTIVNALIQKCIEQMEFCSDPQIRDCTVVASLLSLTHYKMANYGVIAAFARAIGNTNNAEAFQIILKNLYSTDSALTRIEESMLVIMTAHKKAA